MLASRNNLYLVLIGAAGGLLAGLLGVGGGLIMVPMLVFAVGATQHEAHATSLAAIIPIAAVGATRFGMANEIDLTAAAFLALGTLVGAPLGAKLMAKTSEGALKALFGVLTIAIGVTLLWR